MFSKWCIYIFVYIPEPEYFSLLMILGVQCFVFFRLWVFSRNFNATSTIVFSHQSPYFRTNNNHDENEFLGKSKLKCCLKCRTFVKYFKAIYLHWTTGYTYRHIVFIQWKSQGVKPRQSFNILAFIEFYTKWY